MNIGYILHYVHSEEGTMNVPSSLNIIVYTMMKYIECISSLCTSYFTMMEYIVKEYIQCTPSLSVEPMLLIVKEYIEYTPSLCTPSCVSITHHATKYEG